MTNRVFLLAKVMQDNVTSKTYNDSQPIQADFSTNVYFTVLNWQNISTLKQIDITTICNASGFQFDHDE